MGFIGEADALCRTPGGRRDGLPLGEPDGDVGHEVAPVSSSSSPDIVLRLVCSSSVDGPDRRQDVRTGSKKSLHEFRPRWLLKQVMADCSIREIDQAATEDAVERLEVLVAVLLQQRDDLVADDAKKTCGVSDGPASLHEERMADLEIAGVPPYVLTDPAVQGVKPWPQRNVGDCRLLKGQL